MLYQRLLTFLGLMLVLIFVPAALAVLAARVGGFRPPLSHFLVLQNALGNGIVIYLLVVKLSRRR